MHQRWAEIGEIQLISEQNDVNYVLKPAKRGDLIYFPCSFKHKDPHSAAFYDTNGELIHLEEPQIFNGMFGPGVVIT